MPYILLLFSSILFSGLLWADNFEVHSHLEGAFNVISGFNEVANTNEPFSSSVNRPSFEEQGLNSDRSIALGFDFVWDDMRSSIAYRHLSPTHSNILANTLNTLNQQLPAGQNFAMHAHYQCFTVGLAKSYLLLPCLKLNSMVDVNWLNYSYEFNSGIQNGSKEIKSNLSLRLGAELEYKMGEYYTYKASFMGSPPIFMLNIYEAKLWMSYHLYQKNNFSISPYVGISYVLIDLNNKREPRIYGRYQAFPSVFAGLSFKM